MFAEYLKSAKTIFWDFDGVIKDSIEVKSDAFEKLFLSFGSELAARVRTHHEANGGMSRFEKLPIYLDWSGQPSSQFYVKKYSESFSNLVKNKVIEISPNFFEAEENIIKILTFYKPKNTELNKYTKTNYS